VNAINSAAVGQGSAFRSWVDQPVSESVDSAHLVIRGWCYRRDGRPVQRIRARIGRRVFEGSYGDPRPDVFAAFGGEPTADTSGFEVAVVLPAGSSECSLEARLGSDATSAAGEWIGFQRFRLSAPRTGAGERLQWLKFWAGAWAGTGSGWDRLTAAERDYAVGWVRQQGWLNLQLNPQHAPRPVRAEPFPHSRIPAAKLPKLTIVTPSFQQAPFLEATMRSVLEQPGVRIDYIVQDGGSTDGSRELIQRHAHRLKAWSSARDSGQADAIVRGFRQMEAGPDDLMMYLNSDDVLMPNAARFIADYFARHLQIDALYGHRVLIDEDGAEVGRWFTPRTRCDDLRLQDLIPQETLVWRRRIWDRVGGIDPSFHFAMDWDLLLRFQAAGARFARVPRFLGQFRLHTRQKSQAELTQRGIPEMDLLRRRTLGREPTTEEMHCSMRRAQFDSALLLALWRRGVRA
jgi:hypothetical protein